MHRRTAQMHRRTVPAPSIIERTSPTDDNLPPLRTHSLAMRACRTLDKPGQPLSEPRYFRWPSLTEPTRLPAWPRVGTLRGHRRRRLSHRSPRISRWPQGLSDRRKVHRRR